MTFLFRWKHQDGSTVEFSDQGWRSDDPEKKEWLIKMSDLSASYPVLSPAIRMWLRENCQLVEFRGPEDTATPNQVSLDSGVELDELEAFASAVNGGISANLSNGTRLFARTRRKSRISARSVSLACDKFFRSRGLSLKESFNGWHRSHPTNREDQPANHGKAAS
jgi:hypothetical protein